MNSINYPLVLLKIAKDNRSTFSGGWDKYLFGIMNHSQLIQDNNLIFTLAVRNINYINNFNFYYCSRY